MNSRTLFENALIIRGHFLTSEQDPDCQKALQKFVATPSWIEGFVSIHALRSVTLYGKARAFKIENVASGIADLRAALQDFNPEFNSNMDETGLFFKPFPKRT